MLYNSYNIPQIPPFIDSVKVYYTMSKYLYSIILCSTTVRSEQNKKSPQLSLKAFAVYERIFHRQSL